jgi:hypothetical protein
MDIALNLRERLGIDYSRMRSKHLQTEERKLPYMLNSFRKKQLPKMRLQSKLNAFAFPRMGISTNTG